MRPAFVAALLCSTAALADGGFTTDLPGVTALLGWSVQSSGGNARFAVRGRRAGVALRSGRLLLGFRIAELELKAYAEPGQQSAGAQFGSTCSAVARLALAAQREFDLSLTASALRGGTRATGVFRIAPAAPPGLALKAGLAARAFVASSVALVADAGVRARRGSEEWVSAASLFGEVQLFGTF